MKEVVWIGSSRRDLNDLPEEVQDEAGFVLDRVQRGRYHPSIRPLKGLPGVQEIRVNFDTDTYRLVYVLNLGDAVYVLHSFQKKSKGGIATPKREMDVIRARLKHAKEREDDRRAKR